MKAPNSQFTEIIYHANMKGEVSMMNFPYISDFRKYISDLRLDYGIVPKSINIPGISKYGNEYRYKLHVFDEKQKAELLKIYKEKTEK